RARRGAPFPHAPRGTHHAKWSKDRSARLLRLLRYHLRHGSDEGRVTRSRAACPFPGWRNREALGDRKPLGGIDCSFIIREWAKLGCGSRAFFLTGAGGGRSGGKKKFLWNYALGPGPGGSRAPPPLGPALLPPSRPPPP